MRHKQRKTEFLGKVGLSPDELVPDPQIWKEFNVSPMTGWRWTKDKALGFPPPIKIRQRNFRSRRLVEDFKQKMVERALAGRVA